MTRRALIVALAALAGASILPGTAAAAFLGTNGKLAFGSARNGFPADNDLYTMTSSGSTQTRITSLDQDELNPSWSPDGTKLLFERTAGLRPDVYVANADGSNRVQLTTNAASDLRPAWSQSGAQIVFASDRNNTVGVFDLFVMNADGTNQVNITNTPTINEGYPAWSPDGSLIAFSRDGDIYTATPAGTNLARLTTAISDEIEPDWSPSGGQIVYHAGITANDEIWKMNANGTSQVNLTNNGTLVDENPVWSPAGDKIAFVRDALKNAEIYTMNADGTSATRITNNTLMDTAPSWQPIPLAAGTITVQLNAVPDDPQDFSFTAGGGLSPASFQLDDDTNGTLSNQRVFTGVTPRGGYSLAPTAVPGWDVTGSTCSDGSPVSNINVGAAENVTCTFTIQKHTKIVLALDTVPNDAQNFSFTAGGGLSPTSFQLDDDSDPALPNTMTFANLAPGSGYSLAQGTLPAGGWIQASATCNDGSPLSAINVSLGETVTCTVTNYQPAHIVVVNDASPNDSQDFSFTAGGGLSPTSFQLDDDSDGALERSRIFDVAPGSGYSLSASVPGGWLQGWVWCSDGSPVSNINVSPHETVICTFNQLKHGQLTIVADAQPNDAQDFSFTAGGGLSPTSFALDDDSNGTLSNTRTFSNVPPGTGYSVSQAVPAGWDESSAICSDGSLPSNIQIAPGESVTCTITNKKRGQLVVVQDTVPNDAQDFSFTAGGGLSPTSFALDDDSNGTLSNTATFTNVAARSGYSISQSVPAGWNADATCNDGSPISNIDIGPAETVTCTFVNQKQASLTIVKDAQPNDAQNFAFTAGGGLTPGSFQLDDDSDAALSDRRTFDGLSPQSGYSVSESATPGWDLTSATCDDGSPISNISLSIGEHVTCTFSNRKRGRIVVVKDTQPDDPQDFSFTAGGGLSPTGFALDDDADPALPNSHSFDDLVPAAGYSLSEAAVVGFVQYSATCSNGSPVSNVNVAAGETVTCTFVNQRGYARPKSAGPLKVSLVPAFNGCTAPNRMHGPSLEYASCNPPSMSSPHLTIGTPDVNGQGANMTGSIAFRILIGNPATPQDEADVTITANVTDVRLRSNLSDYLGELQGSVVLRITDRLNGTGLSDSATVSDTPFNFTIPCTGTPSTTIGATCAVDTSADAVLPGAVTETKRAIWQMGDVRVSDGGPDAQASTQDNSPFLRQGIAVP